MIRIRLNWEKNASRLAAKLAEKLAERAILPFLNRSQIVLDDTSADQPLSLQEAYRLAAEALTEAGIKSRSISISGEEIVIDDEKPEAGEEPPVKLYICPHCGFVTPYEEEYWNHLKIHYVGF